MMRFVQIFAALSISCAIATPVLDYPQSDDYPMAKWPAPSPILRRELLAEYLASLGSPPALQPHDEAPLAMEGRQKRIWGRNRWYGNKYRDNKSYGFWITALNKAGNWKRK